MKKKYSFIIFLALCLLITLNFLIKDQKFIHNKFYRSITKFIPMDVKKTIIKELLKDVLKEEISDELKSKIEKQLERYK